MKKQAWIFFSVLLLLGCNREKIALFDYPPFQTDKKALGVFLTATWSERSGETGMPTFYTMVDTFGSRMIPISAHAATVGDPFYSLAASQFYSLYNTEELPSLGGNALGFPLAQIDNFQAHINQQTTQLSGNDLVPAQPAVVLACAKKINGRNFQAKAKVRIEKPLTNVTLHLAIYMTENQVLGYQEGIGAAIFHQYVLRGSATAGPWGVLWKTGNFAVGETFEQLISYQIAEDMDSNQLNAVAVVYRMENGYPVEVLNCNKL
jgi:hypothetical protein